MARNKKIELRWINSLEKVGPYEKVLPEKISSGCALKGERFNLQLLFCSATMHNRKTEITVISPLKEYISVREVGYVPVTFTGYCKCDDDVLLDGGGVLPDQLLPLVDGCTRIVIRQTKTLWLSVDIPADFPAGTYPLQLQLKAFPDDCDENFAETQETETFLTPEFQLHVADAVLPRQRLKVTQWMHYDSISAAYDVPVWSDEHWRITGNYMRNAACHGMNMILTPVLTPPLNIYPGTYRRSVQLVEISRKKGKYSFCFDRLEKFIKLAQSSGISYFEIGHFFSQWGAAYSVAAEIDGKMEFGWNVRGDSPEYRDFLHHLLTELTAKLRELGISDKCFFHCSDEPGPKHVEQYRNAITFLKEHLPGYRIIDAINGAAIFKACGMDTPVPIITDLHKFRGVEVPERWTYYCCAPTEKAPNRFIHFPSARNRIFGVLMWKYRIDGFLHWGYNFYNEALSRFFIDPEKDPTSDRFYPPGDAFVVYPGTDGNPVDSIRHEVFYEALQDFRALELLEKLYTGKKVRSMLKQWCGTLTMLDYPRGSKAVLALREKINAAVINHK